MTQTVLILGASGKIGTHAVRAFTRAGWTVRLFDRTKDDMTQAAIGADVIVNGMNPPNYHNWAEIIPQITRDVIAAARASGATVVVPGNVYVYGDTPGVWGPDTPHHPVSNKGQIRVDMERAYRDSGVQTIVLRAGNFIDPDRNGDVMSIMVLNAVAKGKITYGGSPEVTQPWCYLPDWAEAVVQLCQMRDTLETFNDIPFPGHAVSLVEIKTQVEALIGKPLRPVRFPWWAMRLAAPVWELAREVNEMRYLWETDHRLDGALLETLLPDLPQTPLRDVLTAALPNDVLGQQNVHPDQPMTARQSDGLGEGVV